MSLCSLGILETLQVPWGEPLGVQGPWLNEDCLCYRENQQFHSLSRYNKPRVLDKRGVGVKDDVT